MKKLVKTIPVFPYWSGPFALSLAFAAVGCTRGLDNVVAQTMLDGSPEASSAAGGDAEAEGEADLHDGGEVMGATGCEAPPPIDRELHDRMETASFAYG